MGMSSDENVKVAEETSGCMRGGARFRQEKGNRIGEGPAAIETQDCEELLYFYQFENMILGYYLKE